MVNNPEIQVEVYELDRMSAKIPQASSLEDLELKFMQEEMPDFKFNEAMYSRFELMQKIPFPAKLGMRRELARIQAEHAHHNHLEKINEVIEKLKVMYYELWLVQQNLVLEQENARLVTQFATTAGTRYATGQSSQQDVIKAQVELSMINNELISLRQRELSSKAMLMALLNRQPKDTLGYAIIPEEPVFVARLDSLVSVAMNNRPMIIHDSLSIDEGKTVYSLAKLEYLPDFKFGLERVTSPSDGFRGWSISAGITLPFAPWTLGKANARVEEATAQINKAKASYTATRRMVEGKIRDLFYKVEAGKQQLENFRLRIIPQARQSLHASLSAYQTGKSDFLMLIDAYRTLVQLTKEYFMTRMQFEQTIAQLEREVGNQYVSTIK
ncbi:MAG: TolC family protein [Ignavibacteriales bacterium]|nr:TolC family protein [Ignavibacteriales bacterium]